MSDNLKQKTVSALKWSAIDRFGQQIIQFFIGIILARLLSPDDYGLIGMIMIFAALSFVLVESGFGQALIRKQDATEIDYSSVFYFNIITSVLLYLLLFFCAPYIALYFNQPQLDLLGKVIFTAILFNAFYLVPYARMLKEMNFKSIAKVNLISTILSGTLGVIMAFTNFGVWSLVAQQVTFHFFRMILYQIIVKWRPGLIFSFNVIREFWGFTLPILGTALLNVIFNNLYVFILGKNYQKKDVGFYTQANKLSETFNFSFQQILLGGTFSMFSQIQNDEPRFRRIFREITRKASIISIPAMLVFIAIAQPFIFVLLSAKWLPSASYFQLLCLASLFTPFYGLNITALNARGLSKQTFIIESTKKILILLSVVVSFRYGVISMLWGYAAASFIAYLLSVFYIKHDIQHFIKNQITDLIPAFTIGLLTAIPVYLMSYVFQNAYILIGVQFAMVLIIYIFSVKVIQPEVYTKMRQLMTERIRTFKK